MMKLSADQEEKIREWAVEGLSLNEIHKRISQELGLAMTYMEARLLVADLQVSLKDKNPPPAPKTDADHSLPADSGDLMDDDDADAPLTGGKLSVTVDAIAKPRTLASGRVTFSDGVGGMWYVDEAGRLGIDLDKPGYRPSETDAMSFQQELQMALQRAGY